VGFVDIYAASPIEHEMDQMAMQAVSKLGWHMHFIDAVANFTTMQQALQSFVNEHDDLIIVASSDAAPIRQGLQAAKAAGIPVVEVGGGNLDPQHLFTATYNENETTLGQMLGAYIVKTVPNAKIADLASTINYSGAARESGLKSAVAASGGTAQIVADQQVNGANIVPSTTQAMNGMLTAHPDINAVFANIDPSAVPAAAVIHSKGSHAKLFTNFATPSNLNLIQKKQLAAVLDDNLPLTVAVAFDQFLKHAKTGAAFDPNAVTQAGGLGYRVVTSPNTVYSNDATIAPFLKKWAAAYHC
jgi:ribose transport system substrate-binding protein